MTQEKWFYIRKMMCKMILSTFELDNSAVMNTYGYRPLTQGLHPHGSSSCHRCSAQPPPCGCSCVGDTLNTSYSQTKPYRSQAGKLSKTNMSGRQIRMRKDFNQQSHPLPHYHAATFNGPDDFTWHYPSVDALKRLT